MDPIEVTNRRRIDGLRFDDYLKISAYSNSGLKAIDQPDANYDTQKIRTGKLVDQILEGVNFRAMTDEQKNASVIADIIRTAYPNVIDKSAKQVSFFGDLKWNGFRLPFKTRPDYVLNDVATIDLKVTWERDIEALIKYMDYALQCHIHRLMSGLDKSYILIHSVPLGRTKLIEMNDDRSDFLIDKIVEYGECL